MFYRKCTCGAMYNAYSLPRSHAFNYIAIWSSRKNQRRKWQLACEHASVSISFFFPRLRLWLRISSFGRCERTDVWSNARKRSVERKKLNEKGDERKFCSKFMCTICFFLSIQLSIFLTNSLFVSFSRCLSPDKWGECNRFNQCLCIQWETDIEWRT